MGLAFNKFGNLEILKSKKPNFELSKSATFDAYHI